MNEQLSATIPQSRAVPRAMVCALVALTLFVTACSDVDVNSAMVEVAREKGERDAAAAIAVAEQEAAAEAAVQETADAAAAATNDSEDASISLNEDTVGVPADSNAAVDDPDTVVGDADAMVDDTEIDEDGDDESEGELAEDLDPGDFPGEAAVVTQGSWTVAENELGVRVRTGPAGDILGFIQRPDVVQTTGRGRILNNVAWGEVQFGNGQLGWMALDLLEASTGRPADNFRNGDGSTATTSGTSDDSSDAGSSADDNDTSSSGDGDDTSTAGETGELTVITVQPQGAFISNRSATLSLYTEPDTRSDVVVVGNAGDQVVIVNPSGYRNGEIPFVRVSFNGAEGWVDGRFLDVTG